MGLKIRYLNELHLYKNNRLGTFFFLKTDENSRQNKGDIFFFQA